MFCIINKTRTPTSNFYLNKLKNQKRNTKFWTQSWKKKENLIIVEINCIKGKNYIENKKKSLR